MITKNKRRKYLNSRERINAALNHKTPDKLPVDFGGTPTSGIHVGVVYKLRQHYGLDKPGTPVKYSELYQINFQKYTFSVQAGKNHFFYFKI